MSHLALAQRPHLHQRVVDVEYIRRAAELNSANQQQRVPRGQGGTLVQEVARGQATLGDEPVVEAAEGDGEGQPGGVVDVERPVRDPAGLGEEGDADDPPEGEEGEENELEERSAASLG